MPRASSAGIGVVLGALCLASGTRPPAPGQAPRYDLVVRIVPDSAIMEVSGTITLPPQDAAREHVELSLSELMSDLRVEVLTPRAIAGGTTLGPHLRPSSRRGWGTTTWIIRPRAPVPPGAPVTLRVHYRGGERTSEIFAINRYCAFAGGIKTAWYPELEEGPPPVASSGELRGVRGTGRLEFRLPAGFTVYAPGDREGESAFAFKRPIYFSFAAARYSVTHSNASIPVRAYLLRPRPAISSYLNGAARVLGVLIHEFGGYPNAQFAIAEVPPAEADSAGFDGASLEGLVLASTTYLDKPFNVAYFGHELSHQWWPNLVASKSVAGARTMLSEGLAQYGSLRAVEELVGPAAAEQYRRTGFPGFYGYGAVEYLRLAAAGEDGALSDLPTDLALQRALVLNKGFFVWDMLSRSVGRDRFRAALHEITSHYAYQRIAWRDFLAIVQRHAGHDLSRFFSDWFDRPGAPDYRLAWRQDSDGVIRGDITQGAPPYTATLEMEARGPGRSAVHALPVGGERTAFAWTPGFRGQDVALDPHHLVLRWEPNDRVDATALAPYTRVSLLMDQGRGSEAEQALRVYFDAHPMADRAGLPFMMHVAYARLLTYRHEYGEALAELRQALAEPVRRADELPRVFGLLAEIGFETRHLELTKSAADSAVTADSAIGGLTGAGEDARRLVKTMEGNANP